MEAEVVAERCVIWVFCRVEVCECCWVEGGVEQEQAVFEVSDVVLEVDIFVEESFVLSSKVPEGSVCGGVSGCECHTVS